jgi:hypothetical protein
MIVKSDIKTGANFECSNGIVWIVDNIEVGADFTLVNTSMEGGNKNYYRDDIETFVDFLNEKNAKKRMD